MKRIILTGGGTMGHVSPNIALIPILAKKFDEVHYIGSKSGIEREKVEALTPNYKNLFYHPISATKLDRSNLFKNLKIPFVLLMANKEAKALIKNIAPAVVFSKGGYVSVPVVRSAQRLNIPTIIHESDLSLGLANRLCAKKATSVCTTFLETAKRYKNGVFTGSPVSSKLIFADKQLAYKKYNLNPRLKTITITGGSLGATPINNAVKQALPSLVQKYNIIHLTGKGKRIDFSHPNYHQEEFSDDIGSIFKASDLVVSRAGSNTIFELALLKTPMLLIPLSKKASRGDQLENAEYFKRLKIAEVLTEENLHALEEAIDQTISRLPSIKTELIRQNFSSGLDKLLNEIYKTIKYLKKE